MGLIGDMMNLEHFILKEYDFYNEVHVNLKNNLINSEGSELVSKDISNYIVRNYHLHQQDEITNTYVVVYDNEMIGLAFVNYHPEEEIRGELLPEEIEIGAGLLPEYRGKHLGSNLEKELSDALLEMYPEFAIVVARIESSNTRSIKSAIRAGFEHIKDDEYHYRRK